MDKFHSGLFDERYKRQMLLPGFGREAQEKLAAAKVLVVGAGGLGVPVLQYLTGMGIGTIEIVDGDLVGYSNLHRQVLYDREDVGLSKALTAARKLQKVNPAQKIGMWPAHLDVENALDIIRKYDLVVDATDNFSARYLINDACVILGKPFVYGAVNQYEGHVSIFNFEGGPTYRCLYPEQPSAGEIPDCNTAGVLGVIPGLVGCRQALEVVKMITGIGRNLSGYLQVFDYLNDEQYKIKLTAKPANKMLKTLQASYVIAGCTPPTQKITAQDLQQWYKNNKPFLLVDVRREDEFKEAHLPGAVNWSLNALWKGLFSFDENSPVVLYCQRGGRSAKAAAFLHGRQPALQIFELADGMDNWLKQQSR